MDVVVSILTVKCPTKTFVLRFPCKVLRVEPGYVLRMSVKRRIFRRRETPAEIRLGSQAISSRKELSDAHSLTSTVLFLTMARFCLFASPFLLVVSLGNTQFRKVFLIGLINGVAYTRVL